MSFIASQALRAIGVCRITRVYEKVSVFNEKPREGYAGILC